MTASGGKTYDRKPPKAIRTKRNSDKHNRSPDIHRHREHITHKTIIPQTPQDSREEGTKPIEKNVLTELGEGREHELGITQSNAHLLPAEVLTAHVLPALFVAHAHHVLLFVGEEVGVAGVVRETEPD